MFSIDGYTALTAACFSGNLKMLSRLIELGADVNYQKSVADYPPIFYVCRFCKDNVEILELLVENGADINQTILDGKNLLHIAAESAYLNTVEKLLTMGFDPNSSTFKGESPLYLVLFARAETENILKVVKALVAAGSEIKREDRLGETPLSIAASRPSLCEIAIYFSNL